MILGIIKSIENFIAPAKNWLWDNFNNPFLWLGLFLLGLVVFWLTYSALHKDK